VRIESEYFALSPKFGGDFKGEKTMLKALTLTGVLVLSACTQSQNADSTGKVAVDASLGKGPTSSPAAPSKKYDGPFGLQSGLTVEEVKRSVPDLTPDDNKPGWYSATNVPTPHPSFDSYRLAFSTKSGLCVLSGIGKNITSGSSGAEVQAAFEDLATALSERYGHGKKYDFYTGASSGNPQYWMMNLKEKDRVFAMLWGKDTGATLPATISGIGLDANALDMETGYISVRYEFSNVADCVAEEKARKNKAL
jgi:hypothetical protein